MNWWIKGIMLGVGILFLLLSAIFFLAGLSPDVRPDILAEAVVLLVFGLIPLGAVFLIIRKEASRPVNISQEIKINAGELSPGERTMKEMECRNCGAVLSSSDYRLTDIGIAVKCPFCGSAYMMEEEPKW